MNSFADVDICLIIENMVFMLYDKILRGDISD